MDAGTGKFRWKFSTNGIIVQRGFCIHNNVIYFGSFDCNVYAVNADGKLVWKFPTSLSFQSPIHIEGRGAPESFEFTWRSETEGEKKPKDEEPEIRDYGEFSGSYMSKGKSDYASSGKRSYIKKREF